MCAVLRETVVVLKERLTKPGMLGRVMRRVAEVGNVKGVMQPDVCGVNGTIDGACNVYRGKNAT